MRGRFRGQQQQQQQQSQSLFVVPAVGITATTSTTYPVPHEHNPNNNPMETVNFESESSGAANTVMGSSPTAAVSVSIGAGGVVEVDDADIAAGKAPHSMAMADSAATATATAAPTTTTTVPLSGNGIKHNKKNNSGSYHLHIHYHPYHQPYKTFGSGTTNLRSLGAPRSSAASLASIQTASSKHPSDLEFFEDLVSEPVLVLGVDISHLDRNTQFFVCAAGVFGFSLLYGYLQELISVQLCGRRLGLFLAMVQFTGYTILAFVLRNFVYAKQQRHLKQRKLRLSNKKRDGYASGASSSSVSLGRGDGAGGGDKGATPSTTIATVPLVLYLGLSILRAIDLGMTNMAMQYINYPAKTLMKSSRVVFTMLFGVVITRKSYELIDYAIVLAMVAGLAIFMHADASSSAVFDIIGVGMLTVSLVCDGAISNVSETIMSKFGVGQDEFIFRMYSIALVAITIAATVKGDLTEGFIWLLQPGTYDELNKPIEERTWTVMGKIIVIVLFSSMGFFGSSCAAAITKNFGALSMSITSTARKASTLFLSFFLFNNVCTLEHILGIVVFISALTAKSFRRSKGGKYKAGEIMRQQRELRKQRQIKRCSSGVSDVSGQSSVSDVSDIEIAGQDPAVVDHVPSVVHTTETLRIRQVAAGSPSRQLLAAERRALVGVV